LPKPDTTPPVTKIYFTGMDYNPAGLTKNCQLKP